MNRDFTDYLTDIRDPRLFFLCQKSQNLAYAWKQLQLIREKELLEPENIREMRRLEFIGSNAVNCTDIANKQAVVTKWIKNMMYQETDATYLYLYSSNPDFMKRHLIVTGDTKILGSDMKNTIFFSPHWGDYYSLPVVLASMGVLNIPLANGDEGNHMRSIIETLKPEVKEKMPRILDTSNPYRALQELDISLRNEQNVVIFPEFTIGSKPKYNTKYFGTSFPVAHGVPALAKRNKSKLVPITIERVDEEPHFELRVYSPLKNIDELSIDQISEKIHKKINEIVSMKPEKWWYWNIFDKNKVSEQ